MAAWTTHPRLLRWAAALMLLPACLMLIVAERADQAIAGFMAALCVGVLVLLELGRSVGVPKPTHEVVESPDGRGLEAIVYRGAPMPRSVFVAITSSMAILSAIVALNAGEIGGRIEAARWLYWLISVGLAVLAVRAVVRAPRAAVYAFADEGFLFGDGKPATLIPWTSIKHATRDSFRANVVIGIDLIDPDAVIEGLPAHIARSVDRAVLGYDVTLGWKLGAPPPDQLLALIERYRERTRSTTGD